MKELLLIVALFLLGLVILMSIDNPPDPGPISRILQQCQGEAFITVRTGEGEYIELECLIAESAAL